jgi:hypothetical protein
MGALRVTRQHPGSDAEEDGEEDGEDELGSPLEVSTPRHQSGPPSPLIGGLKQRLLACLFLQAQQQALEAAAAAKAAPSPSLSANPLTWGTGASTGANGGMTRATGSDGNLPSATASGMAPPRLPRVAGSSGNLPALLPRRPLAGGGPAAGPVLQPHWRRPLDRFFYFFEAYLELLMWRVSQPWAPPESLQGAI